MRYPMTAVAALTGLLALSTAPVFGADPQQADKPVTASATATHQAAKPADTTKKTEPAAQQPAAKAPEAKPAEAKPAAKPNPNALSKNAYGGGFRMTSENGRFSMRLMGAAQFRYTYMAYDNNVNGNTEDYSNFFMRRARLWFDGHAYDPRFTYYFHVQLEPQSAVNLHDAWINYAFKPMLQVGLGRNKVAYGLEFLNSGFGLNMVERSIMYGETDIVTGGGLSKWPGGGTENLALSSEDANTGFQVGGMSLFRSQGVQLSGRNGDKGRVFEYQVGAWTGRNSKGASNLGTDHLYAARVGFYPNGFVNWLFAGDFNNTQTLQTGITLSAYRDTRVLKLNAAAQPVPVYDGNDMGVNLAGVLRYKGFSTDVEWSQEQYEIEDATVVGENEFDRAGFRVQSGYFVKPKVVEIVGRFAQLERLKDPTVQAVRNSGLGFARVKNSGGAFQDAVEKNIREYTFGVNYYLSGAAHQHKFFADYSYLTRDFEGFVSGSAISGSAPDQQDHRVRAMLQIKF